jgi:hypothetical protein
MNPRILTPFVLLPLLASCDKAREIANDASAKVREKVVSAAAGKEEPIDPEFAKLVDRNEEGAVFRKDLPFPGRIEVNETTNSDIRMRVFESSAIERRSSNLNGLMTGIEKIERNGDHVRHSRSEMRLTDPTSKDAEGKPKVLSENPLGTPGPGPQRVFHRRNGKWEADAGSGFAVTAQSKDLAPVLDVLLQEHALAPRPQWFAKRRLKVGDEVTLTDESLPVLIGGGAKGTLKLKLESFDAVAGHPCGVFSIAGDYSRRQFPSFDGVFTDEDVTIQSGKVWLSLIHPLVIRWETDTIRTSKTGTKGGQLTHGQGTAKVTLIREWKTLPSE